MTQGVCTEDEWPYSTDLDVVTEKPPDQAYVDALQNKVKTITNDGITVTSTQGAGTTGSPTITPIAPPFSVAVAPATQTDGGRPGTNVDYKLTLTNLGFNADTYKLSSSGGTVRCPPASARACGQPRFGLATGGGSHRRTTRLAPAADGSGA